MPEHRIAEITPITTATDVTIPVTPIRRPTLVPAAPHPSLQPLTVRGVAEPKMLFAAAAALGLLVGMILKRAFGRRGNRW